MDCGITATITYDLFKAMAFGSNEIGVGRNVREVLRHLSLLASVNGVVIVFFQLSLLVAIAVDNTGWDKAALIFLPGLQLLSMLTLVNMPRITTRVQESRQHTFFENDGVDFNTSLPFVANSPGRPLSTLERGRRKLCPFSGKWRKHQSARRSLLPTFANSKGSWEGVRVGPRAMVVTSGGPALGLQEVLEMRSVG